jgi:hypothetical protein
MDLTTTNILLGIMAAVSLLEALALIGIGIFAYREYRRVAQLMQDLQVQHIVPLRAKVDAILADVKLVTARVSHQTERVDHAISGTMERVDETAERVKSSVRDKVSQATGVIRGLRAVIASLFAEDARSKPPAEAAGGL